jgi:uncharacterized protein
MNATLPKRLSPSGDRAQIGMLADGRRAHFSDGPIDLIIEADGSPAAVREAYDLAARRFRTVLDELCSELTELRSPATVARTRVRGTVARRMHSAVWPHAATCFITPMAAVAGAVAEEMLAALTEVEGLTRAYVNNGGDIALHLSSGTSYSVTLVDDPRRPTASGRVDIPFDSVIRGVATSGRHGRSFSLGIADAVTVLARSASQADAAATVIANAVDLPGHCSIVRKPARDMQFDSDLGLLPVTVDVGALTSAEVEMALDRGSVAARRLADAGLVEVAALRLRGGLRTIEHQAAATSRQPLQPTIEILGVGFH